MTGTDAEYVDAAWGQVEAIRYLYSRFAEKRPGVPGPQGTMVLMVHFSETPTRFAPKAPSSLKGLKGPCAILARRSSNTASSRAFIRNRLLSTTPTTIRR